MTLTDIQRGALDLPDSARAALALELLDSLPAVLVEDDEGIAEARRRSRELDDDPSMGMSWEELKLSLGR